MILELDWSEVVFYFYWFSVIYSWFCI